LRLDSAAFWWRGTVGGIIAEAEQRLNRRGRKETKKTVGQVRNLPYDAVAFLFQLRSDARRDAYFSTPRRISSFSNSTTQKTAVLSTRQSSNWLNVSGFVPKSELKKGV